MAKNVIVFPGSFDPVTKGHEAVAAYALNRIQLLTGEEHDLWFLPVNSNAFNMRMYADAHHRLSMLHLVTDRVMMQDNIRVSNFEIAMGNKAGQYAVVNALMRAYPSLNFKYLMGSDVCQMLRQWRNSRNLVKLLPIITVKRKGSYGYYGSSWHRSKPHVFITDEIVKRNISSSMTRSYLNDPTKRTLYAERDMQDIRHVVKEYIFQHELYTGQGS